jgi:thiol-disulfide isomerase/thioredoxin
MVFVALAMLRDYDIKFQNTIANDLPAFLVNPSEALEDTASARGALTGLRGGGHGVGAAATSDAPQRETEASDLPVLGTAPEFVGNQQWFNTANGEPLTLKQLRGRVVLVDFWTYSCINCIRTFPYLKAWDQRYRKDGLTIVGVHTPEFPFEKDPGNVAEAIESNGIRYPVAQDNEFATWNAYGNQYWPAEYFIDAQGKVRYAHFGEGEYDEKEEVIRELLAEAGDRVGKKRAGGRGIAASEGVTTPETYLGAARADRYVNSDFALGVHDFSAPDEVPADHFAYRGRWRVGADSSRAEGGSLDLDFGARRVYLVIGSPGQKRKVRVLLDGKPIPAEMAGEDVRDGAVTVSGQRLYSLVEMPSVGHHLLTLEPETGVEGYAFTFG